MNELFIVAWTGGFEFPSFTAHWTADEARQQAESWTKEADIEGGDTIIVLRVNLLSKPTIEIAEIR